MRQRIEMSSGASWLAIPVVAALFAAVPLAAQDFSQVQIKTVPVAGGVYMLVGAGGNIGVSTGDDGVFLVDDQFAPLTEKILAAVGEISDGEVRFVLNTHYHGDHSGGNENLGKAGVLIVAHENVRVQMGVERFLAAINSPSPAAPPGALPVVTFTDAVTFHLNDDEIHAYHVPPAHTDGDSVVHFRKSDVVHMGDLYFNGLYPFIDTVAGGHLAGVIAAVERVLPTIGDSTKIIPGHGSLSNKAELTAYLEMLRGVHGAVRPLVDAGKSKEEAVAAKPTAPWDEKWGKGFLSPDVFAGIVYDGMR